MEVSQRISGATPLFRLSAMSAFGVLAALLVETPVVAVEGQPLGPQFTANTTVDSSQGYPGGLATTALSDGGFIIVWTDGYPEINTVAGQRFDAKGAKVGSEFAIATPSDVGYYDVAASGLTTGGFVVVWDREFSSSDVFAQVFDSAGSPVGTEFLVNTTTTLNQGFGLRAEGLGDGTFVVVWADDSAGDYDVAGKRFSSTGAALGTEFVVNTELVGSQGLFQRLDLAKLDGGGFVVAWGEHDAPGNDGTEVAAQRFDSSGAMLGSQFVVSAATVGDQGYFHVDVAGLEGGGFVVAWDAFDSIFGYDIAARRFDSNGAPIGNDFVVNSRRFSNAGSNAEFGAAGLPGGGFVVAWGDSYAPGGDGDDVWAQRFDSAGARVGTQFIVNSALEGIQGGEEVHVATLVNGAFVVAWDDYDSESSSLANPDVFGRVFEGPGCNPTPADGCARPAKTLLKMKQDANPAKRKLLWKWLRGTIDAPDLGDPTSGSTGYTLCVYDDAAGVATLRTAAQGTCDGVDCWESTTTGFQYANGDTNADGIFKLQLNSGDGNAKIIVKARGANLAPPFPITQSSAVRVQLLRTDGAACWESFFTPPAIKHDDNNLKDKENTQPECGNASIEVGEDCDSGNLDGETCATLGFDGGSLNCDDPICRFDTSGCFTNKIVFATHYRYNGKLGGLSGADEICNAHAFEGSLPGTYKAWLADNTGSPSTRFSHSPHPYELVDGTLIANDWADLTDGTIQNPISKDELGDPLSGTLAWTNVNTTGITNNLRDCLDWNSDLSGVEGNDGMTPSSSSSWTLSSASRCHLFLHLYCFQQ